MFTASDVLFYKKLLNVTRSMGEPREDILDDSTKILHLGLLTIAIPFKFVPFGWDKARSKWNLGGQINCLLT